MILAKNIKWRAIGGANSAWNTSTRPGHSLVNVKQVLLYDPRDGQVFVRGPSRQRSDDYYYIKMMRVVGTGRKRVDFDFTWWR